MNELKFLGLPLEQIGELLRKGWTIVDALQRQQRVLAEKRRQLDQAILAIGAAERSLQSAREPDWKELLAGFTGGDPEIQKGLNAMYADQNNWPTEQKQKWQIRPEIMTFIQKGFAAGTGR